MYAFYLLIRILLYPIVRFLIPLLSKSGRKRLNFELKELTENSVLNQAEYGFEVSSEGELEQVYPLISTLLENKKTVEIVYCSESVEHKCQAIQKNFSDQVRLLRLPILRFNPVGHKTNAKNWLTCKTFIMCRYDFFTELISYGQNTKREFILISGMAKTFKNKNLIAKLYLRYCYQSFDKIIAATKEDQYCFEKDLQISSKSIDVFDFRKVQIQKRQSHALDTVSSRIAGFDSYKDYIEKQSQRIILGSFWNHDRELLHFLDYKSQHILIAPHKLDQHNIEELESILAELKIPSYLIQPQMSESELKDLVREANLNPGIWISTVKGILCEMFVFFDKAYIGGGFGESIHSVLEPYIGGCTIYCGPNIERSSEFRFISEVDPLRISSLDDYQKIGENLSVVDAGTRVSSSNTDGHSFENILKWLSIEV